MIKPDDSKQNDIIRQLDDDIFTAVFRKGAYAYLEDTGDDTALGTLSDSGSKRVMQLIKKELRRDIAKRVMRKLPKIAAVIFIVIAVCTATIMSVEALRVPVLNLFIRQGESSTDVTVGGELTPHDAGTDIYIPAGFELMETEESESMTIYIYSSADGQSLFINRYVSGSSYGFDSEVDETGEVDINGYNAIYNINNGIVALTFNSDEYAYLIQAPVALPEVIKIAESLH